MYTVGGDSGFYSRDIFMHTGVFSWDIFGTNQRQKMRNNRKQYEKIRKTQPTDNKRLKVITH